MNFWLYFTAFLNTSIIEKDFIKTGARNMNELLINKNEIYLLELYFNMNRSKA